MLTPRAFVERYYNEQLAQPGDPKFHELTDEQIHVVQNLFGFNLFYLRQCIRALLHSFTHFVFNAKPPAK